MAAHFSLKEISQWYMQLTLNVWAVLSCRWCRSRSALLFTSQKRENADSSSSVITIVNSQVSPLSSAHRDGDTRESTKTTKSSSIAPFSASETNAIKNSNDTLKESQAISSASNPNSSFHFVTTNPSFAKRESANALKKSDSSSSSSSTSFSSNDDCRDTIITDLRLQIVELKEKISHKEFLESQMKQILEEKDRELLQLKVQLQNQAILLEKLQATLMEKQQPR
jgi:hypothetical protein